MPDVGRSIIYEDFQADALAKSLATVGKGSYRQAPGYTVIWPESAGPCTLPFLQYDLPCTPESIQEVAFRAVEFVRIQNLIRTHLANRPSETSGKTTAAHRLSWTVSCYRLLSQALDATNVSPLFLPGLRYRSASGWGEMGWVEFSPGNKITVDLGGPSPGSTPVGVNVLPAPALVQQQIDRQFSQVVTGRNWAGISRGYPDPQIRVSWLVPRGLWTSTHEGEDGALFPTFIGSSFEPVTRGSQLLTQVLLAWQAPLDIVDVMTSPWQKLLWLFEHARGTEMRGSVLQTRSSIGGDFQRTTTPQAVWVGGYKHQMDLAAAWCAWMSRVTFAGIAKDGVRAWLAHQETLPKELRVLDSATIEAISLAVEADTAADFTTAYAALSLVIAGAGSAKGAGLLMQLGQFFASHTAVGSVLCPQFPFKRDVKACDAWTVAQTGMNVPGGTSIQDLGARLRAAALQKKLIAGGVGLFGGFTLWSLLKGK